MIGSVKSYMQHDTIALNTIRYNYNFFEKKTLLFSFLNTSIFDRLLTNQDVF